LTSPWAKKIILSFWFLKGSAVIDNPTSRSGRAAVPYHAEESADGRILVLDDEAAARRMFREALEDSGWNVDCAANGKAGLQMLMQRDFDVLVVDLKMGGMDGLVFLEEALNVWPWLGVVIVSGHINDAVRERARALGVATLLAKPVRLQDLREVVREQALQKRNAYARVTESGSLAVICDHLKLLTRLGNSAMQAGSLGGALRELADVLAGMLTADVVGIMVVEHKEENPQVLLIAKTAVTGDFLAQVQKEMLDRYEAVTGTGIVRDRLLVSCEGVEPLDSGPEAPLSVLSVPAMAGEEFGGVVTVAAAEPAAYKPSDVSLLYHAANHISAVFLALRRMQQMAMRDYLTGVFNRVRLEEELERTWLVSRRYESPLGVVVADIDEFKTANDAYGHSVGDEILREFATLLKEVARASDIIARYGGDEFVIILPMADESDARTFGQRFIRRVRGHVFCENSHHLQLTCSIGIATSDNPTSPATGEELLSQADRALFTAKRAGRDRICVWPEQTVGAAGQASGKAADKDLNCNRGEEENRHRVAVVDDEAPIRDLVTRMLLPDGHEVATFASAAEALEAIRDTPAAFGVLLTDLSLPGKSGIDLLREVREIDDSIVRIVMTGYATVDSAVNCLREGAYDFIQKPVQQVQLSALVKRALEYRRLRTDNQRYQADLEEIVKRRSAQLAASLEETRKSYEFTLDAMVAMLDARERQAGTHSTRTRELAVMLARHMGVTGDAIESVASGAFLHDIGKIGIPDSILLKPGPLEAAEWEVMKTHSEIGYNILRSNPSLKHAADVVYSHHERYDGDGYPRGLKGEEICIGARIFAVVDAYDTMRSVRVYRQQVPPEEAVAEIKRGNGTQFDPAVVDVFLQHHREMERILGAHEEASDLIQGRKSRLLTLSGR